MKNIVVPSRYAFFASFVICNAIIASVAIWNMGIAQALGRDRGVDAYVIFVSILSLLFYFVVVMAEHLRRDVFLACVWFECVWVGCFVLMELAAAILSSATLPAVMCNADAVSKISSACTSTRVVLVFSWIITLLALMYLLLLGLSALFRSKSDEGIWFNSVHHYPWQEFSEKARPDMSASLPRFRSDPLPVSLPKSRRSYLPPKSRSSTSISTASEETIVEPTMHTTPLPPPPRPTKKTTGLTSNPAVKPAPQSLYPRHIDESSNLPLRPLVPPHVGPSPQPLGNWPRANIMNEPVRKKRVPELPALKPVNPPSQRSEPSARSAISAPSSSSMKASPNPISQTSTPTHPKKPSGDWRSRVVVPPPLDLSKISATRPRTTR